MSDKDDIQLDEETLKQIEEEAMREAKAQLEADDELNRQIREQAMRETGGDLEISSSEESASEETRPPQNTPEPDDDFEDEEEDEYRPKSSIELLEDEVSKKSGRLKAAIFIMIGILILGGIGVGLIIVINKKRAEKSANVEPIKVGPRGKSMDDPSSNDRDARILLSKIRQLAGRKRVIATQVEDGLKFVDQIRKEYPEFSKENEATIESAEKKLKEKQIRLQEMLNMGN